MLGFKLVKEEELIKSSINNQEIKDELNDTKNELKRLRTKVTRTLTYIEKKTKIDKKYKEEIKFRLKNGEESNR